VPKVNDEELLFISVRFVPADFTEVAGISGVADLSNWFDWLTSKKDLAKG
jgi:hypothetical protein